MVVASVNKVENNSVHAELFPHFILYIVLKRIIKYTLFPRGVCALKAALDTNLEVTCKCESTHILPPIHPPTHTNSPAIFLLFYNAIISHSLYYTVNTTKYPLSHLIPLLLSLFLLFILMKQDTALADLSSIFY